jgi:hypothetical protein
VLLEPTKLERAVSEVSPLMIRTALVVFAAVGGLLLLCLAALDWLTYDRFLLVIRIQ